MDSNVNQSGGEETKVKIGICTMEKKVNSKHMQNILKGLQAFTEFEIIIFSEEVIFNNEIEVS